MVVVVVIVVVVRTYVNVCMYVMYVMSVCLSTVGSRRNVTEMLRNAEFKVELRRRRIVQG